MYGKLIEGRLMTAPRKLPGDGISVYNPPAEMYLDQGWLPITFIDQPAAPEGYHYKSRWEEAEDAIIQTWTLVKNPDDIEDSEAIEILLGGDGV